METRRMSPHGLRFAIVLAMATSGMACDRLDDLRDAWNHHRPDGGTSGQSCTGDAGAACPASSFCEQPTGVCVQPTRGACRPRPEVCTQQFAPVCGCDGKTYGNDCQRQAAGVSKRTDGACADRIEVGVGESCEGFTPPPIRVCQAGLFCMLPAGSCNIADIPGVCEETPTACTREYNPVCGCDGKTYGNDCERRAARIALDHAGACQPSGGGEGAMCGGIAGFPCAAGLFCEPPADSCQVADVAGVCRPQPTICTRIYAPVCGCDGKTYGNDCERQAAGVAKRHDGTC